MWRASACLCPTGVSMHGHFEAVGEQGFSLDKSVRCSAYVWHCAPEFGSFTVRFICPVEEEPRRLFIEDSLEDLKRSSPSAFVEQACQCGSKILGKIEAALDLPASDEKLWPALFRHRRTGHAWVSRRFDDVSDFVKYDLVSRRAELILPGGDIDNTKTPRFGTDGYERKKQEAHRLLRLLLSEKKQYYRDSDVIGCFQQKIAAQGVSSVPIDPLLSEFPLSTFPHRGPIDSILMDGAFDGGKAAEFSELCGKVGAAFISEFSLRSDTQLAREYQEEYLKFLNRIDEKVQSKSPEEFDRWFKGEREHGFVRLLGTKRSSAGTRQQPDARERGKTFYRMSLWLAYEMMSRCYGALMLVAWLDFCDDGHICPNDLEQLLFRRMHAPQYYLAGLPVAFLGPSQLRFIAERLLLEVWAPAKILQPEAYLPLADMLSCYAFLNSERRLADREQKGDAGDAPKTVSLERLEVAVLPEARELDDIESFPMLSSLDCRTCGKALRSDKALTEPKDDIVALRLYCPTCDSYQSYRVSLSWLESLKAQGR